MIKPDRSNWKQFCEEAPLSDEEYAEWKEMCKVIIEDDDAFVFIEERTETEWKEAMMQGATESWLDVAKWADANRRLAKAELKAWKEWKKEKK